MLIIPPQVPYRRTVVNNVRVGVRGHEGRKALSDIAVGRWSCPSLILGLVVLAGVICAAAIDLRRRLRRGLGIVPNGNLYGVSV